MCDTVSFPDSLQVIWEQDWVWCHFKQVMNLLPTDPPHVPAIYSSQKAFTSQIPFQFSHLCAIHTPQVNMTSNHGNECVVNTVPTTYLPDLGQGADACIFPFTVSICLGTCLPWHDGRGGYKSGRVRSLGIQLGLKFAFYLQGSNPSRILVTGSVALGLHLYPKLCPDELKPLQH